MQVVHAQHALDHRQGVGVDHAFVCIDPPGAAARHVIQAAPIFPLENPGLVSVPLGFLAGALGLQGWAIGAWPLWFPLLVFAPFMCDATLTLLKRLWRREPVWRAHREHYYQRLVRMGFGHRGAAYVEYAAMAGCAVLALLVFREPAAVQGIAITFAVVALSGVAVWIDTRWAQFLRSAGDAAR